MILLQIKHHQFFSLKAQRYSSMQNVYPNFLIFYSISIINKIKTSLHMKIPFFKTNLSVVNDHLCMKDVTHNVHIPMFTRILDYAKVKLQTLKYCSIMQTTSFSPLVVHEQFAQINNDVHSIKSSSHFLHLATCQKSKVICITH